MSDTLLVLAIITYVVILFLVILNIKILKLLGRYIQLVEQMKENPSFFKQNLIEEIPPMKIITIGKQEIELTIDDSTEKDFLLLFLSPGCQACKSIYKEIKSNINSDRVNTLVISNDLSLENNKEYLRHFNNEDIDFSINENLFQDLKIQGIPHMIYMKKNRKVLNQGHPVSGENLYKLVKEYSSETA
ncbi:thioredoxin-like domain-containing protein [Planomicrobium okeanokoites]|uniref:thioredoxin-like domain-containing protein n=1 Tax=Planomicrobium okeanokoites TaxID=244 RepID=UPI00248F8DB7|nr:thioredoxin-like domain-containing protein [Planomicrobium okeanokoites]